MSLRIVYCSNIKTNTFVVCQKYMYDTVARTGTGTVARTGTGTVARTGTGTVARTGTGTVAHTGPRKGTVKVKVQVLKHVKVQGKVL